jgi:hypothetical protein
MNRKQLREELAFLLNFTEGQADQDFAKARLNKLIDRAYNLEVERSKTGAVKAYFQGATADFTWAASAQTLAVPSSLQAPSIIDVYDITSGEPGVPLVFGDDAFSGGDLFWKDRETWQWTGVGGPGSALTLRGIYEQCAEDLRDDEAEPELIPAQFHYLIVWTAAALGRGGADDSIPSDWKEERREMRLDFYKHVSKARPKSRVNTIKMNSSDTSGVLE